MQKLTLRIDALAVESFPVDSTPAARIGTVHGQVDDDAAAAVMTTVQGQPTCLIGVCTCWYTCQSCVEASCAAHCVTVAQPADAAFE